MAPVAGLIDVERMFRALTAEETAVVPSWLEYVSAQARVEAPWVDARMAADDEYARLARGVVASAVVRVLRNPDGWRQWSVDDASFTRDQVASAGLLYLTPGEVAQLRATPTEGGGPYVVSLSG